MARHNYVNVIGFVSEKPEFNECLDGKIGYVEITTIMPTRELVKAKTGYQLNSVIFPMKTTDQRLIEKMELLEEGDIILIDGFIATYDVEKKAQCPHCGIVNRRIDACVVNGAERAGGTDIYVYPIDFYFLEHLDETEDLYMYLRERGEAVNKVFLLGNMTKQPITGELDNGKKIYTRYQVAINRKFCPKNSNDVLKRTDYPWIYSYGDKATEDFQSLDKGALIFVDGALQARKYKERYICPHCGEEYESRGRTLEVLSYDTEYLRLPSFENNQNL